MVISVMCRMVLLLSWTPNLLQKPNGPRNLIFVQLGFYVLFFRLRLEKILRFSEVRLSADWNSSEFIHDLIPGLDMSLAHISFKLANALERSFPENRAPKT